MTFDPLETPRAAGGRKTAMDYVYETLRERILTGALRGGERLLQTAISESLGVSNTPVREALRDLASEGLINLDSHRGAEVRTVTFEEVEQLYKLRVALEPLLMERTIERIGDGDIESIRHLDAAMQQEHDPQRWVQLNSKFHAILAEVAEWPLLERFLRSLQARAAIYIGVEVQYSLDGPMGSFWRREIETGNREHTSIVEACAARDSERAQRLIAEHLSSTMASLRASTSKGPGSAH